MILALFLLATPACNTRTAQPVVALAECPAAEDPEVRWLSTRLDRIAQAVARVPGDEQASLLAVHDVLAQSLDQPDEQRIAFVADEVRELEIDVAAYDPAAQLAQR